MKVTMSFKNVKSSQRLERVIQEKTKKIAKFFEGQTTVSWIISKRDRGVIVDIKMTGPNFQYHAQTKTDNLYKGVDMTVTKIERQVQKKKEKVRNKLHRGKGAKENNILAFTPKKTWEKEEQAYNESIKKAA